MKFLSPVYINDTITVKIKVIEFPMSSRVRLSTICVNQNDVIVIEGEALIIPPRLDNNS